jgi:hypothetical protein
MRKEHDKTIVNIEEISDCSPQLKIAKNAFLDFQSSALPTELLSHSRAGIEQLMPQIGKTQIFNFERN